MSKFDELTEIVFSKNQLQKKRIGKFIREADHHYLEFCEELSEALLTRLLKSTEEREFACDSYLKMCRDFLHAQVRFKQSGVYPVAEASEAKREVYDNPEVMRYYMLGLLLSYMYWPNHYRLFHFFQKCLRSLDSKPCNYLEIGVGHGLFTSEILRAYPEIHSTVVDISETSIKAADKLLQTFDIPVDRVNFIHSDFFDLKENDQLFDFIIMGEVLEHVNDGHTFMKKAHGLLRPGGKIFMTTAANSPALDHVLHFTNANEIRALLIECGFKIDDDLVMAAEDVPEKDWESELVTLNYGSLLSKA
jgi:2-polyprenyl-3-methyl-5-hydroxy-6-metoxy-1,4-benzoquinol methylase